MKPKIMNQVVLMNTPNIIKLHIGVVEEITRRYFTLRDKEINNIELTLKDQIELKKLLKCVKTEMRRKVEPGSLEDRINRFLDENLPL